MTELVGRPGDGRVFEQPVRPGFADCAPSGRVRLDALARWLQDVAYADVEDAGLAETAVWVVRRTRIDVRRFPHFGEQFRLATFCSGMGRMWAERRTTVTQVGASDADVEAVALWVHLDPVDWRPIPLGAGELERYGAAAAGRRVTARLRHPAPDGVAERLGVGVQRDRARHRRARQQRRVLDAARGGAARRSGAGRARRRDRVSLHPPSRAPSGCCGRVRAAGSWTTRHRSTRRSSSPRGGRDATLPR